MIKPAALLAGGLVCLFGLGSAPALAQTPAATTTPQAIPTAPAIPTTPSAPTAPAVPTTPAAAPTTPSAATPAVAPTTGTTSTPPAVAPSPGTAPTSASPKPGTTGTLTPDQVTDAQVKQLANSLVEIEPLLQKASKELTAAKTDGERTQIEQKFEAQATKIVQDKGLTVEQYRQLITLANSNPTFGQRVATQLRQVKPGGGAAPSTAPGSPAAPAATPAGSAPGTPKPAGGGSLATPKPTTSP